MNDITSRRGDKFVFIYYLGNNLGKLILSLSNKTIIASYFERSIFGPNREGWIYKARVKRYVDFLNSCFVELDGNDIGFFSAKNKQYEPGEFVLLKVKRNPISNKKILLSTQISLREKFLILASNSGPTRIRISKKISKGSIDINNIKRALPKEGYQLIFRSSAQFATTEQILKNFRLLQLNLIKIQQIYELKTAPGLIYQKENYLSEFLSQIKTNLVYTNNIRMAKKEYSGLPPKEQSQIKFNNNNLSNLNLMNTIVDSFKNVFILSNGISLNFDKTEMGWMIDINSGSKVIRNSEKEEKEDPDIINFRINKNATNVVVEQLHLRNMYGIIIIDYINIGSKLLRFILTDYLRELTLNDRNLIRIHNMNDEGLVTLIRESKNIVQNYVEEERLFWLMYFDLQKKLLNRKHSITITNLIIKNFKLLNFVLNYGLTKFLDPLVNNISFRLDGEGNYEINIQ